MTWAEFLIRLHGFRRDQEKGVMMLRELSWMVYVSPHQDPKKMKKTIDAFWPLKKSVSKEKRDVMIERFKEAQVKYLEEKRLKMADDLKFKAGADVRNLVQGIKQVEKEIAKLIKEQQDLAVEQAKGERSLESYNKALARNQRQLNLQTKVLHGAASSAKGMGISVKANAVPAMQEFSRVIQDAPYGIQGVANNIQQLTAQFGYLSAKTGGAKNALKAMTGALWGPAGVLLAVSAITAGLPYLIDALKSSKDALEETKFAVDDLTNAYDRYLQKSKDAQTLIDEQTKMQIAQAKLMGASEDEINRITAQGVSKRVSAIGKEMQERSKLINEYTTRFNELFERGDEKSLKLAEEYNLESDKLRRKNEESRIEIQKLGNTIVLNDLALALSKKEAMIRDSAAIVEGIYTAQAGSTVTGFEATLFTREEMEEARLKMLAGYDVMISDAEKFKNSMEGALSSGISTAVLGLATMISSGFEGATSVFRAVGSLLLDTVGNIAIQLGTYAIGIGITLDAIKASLAAFSGGAAIAAGVALLAIGAAAKSFSSNLAGSNGSSSGVGGGGSSSFSGSSVSSSRGGSSGGTYVFEIEGTKLVGVLSNTLQRNKSLGGNLSLT